MPIIQVHSLVITQTDLKSAKFVIGNEFARCRTQCLEVSEELVSMHHLLSFSVILIRYRYGGFFAPDVV